MPRTIARPAHLAAIDSLFSVFPVVAVLGARQVGKSTLARTFAKRSQQPVEFLDLEDPEERRRLADPGLVLRSLRGLVVLDEVQRLPEVFPLLRVLADRPARPARFLVLGSASPDLLQQTSESLAGRIGFHHLGGLDVGEVGIKHLRPLWQRGGFPRSFLAADDAASFLWRQEFSRTFFARDLPLLGSTVPPATMERFWAMLAHWHGQLWNSSEFARAFGVADTTVRRYLDLLTSAFLVRQLRPWHENVGKRQVKSPKVYLADSGLLHAMLGLRGERELQRHPKVGASWEGFLLQQVVSRLGAEPEECHFWRTQAGAELDLLVVRGARRLGFEFKYSEQPAVTPSMRSALTDLKLDELTVVHGGTRSWPMADGIRALAASQLLAHIAPL
ncbi:MAG TPA: ATP-binding protein [Planctomycetota bacterium]|nr:ATP-binding protein [Planctomycetota bacterium]